MARPSFGARILLWSLVIGHWSFCLNAQNAPSPTPAPIRPIAPPIDDFPYPAWLVATVAIVAALLIAGLVWLIVRWIKNRPAAPPPTPREIAMTRLNQARGQIESMAPYDFSFLVSDLLRDYVAAQFHLRAKEQTSPEFLASISDHQTFSEHERTLLAVFLEKSDLIKFARIHATTEDSATLVDQAIRFVEGVAS